MSKKTYRDFISEMPSINTHFSKEEMGGLADDYRDIIKNHSNKETHLGNGHYHTDVGTSHAYYTKNQDGSPNAISIVNKEDNVHRMVHKGSDSAATIHKFMTHHAKTHGSIKTDISNTKGSKHLWHSLVKSSPDHMKFYMHDRRKGTTQEINKHNIDDHINHIWGNSGHHTRVQVEMKHDPE